MTRLSLLTLLVSAWAACPFARAETFVGSSVEWLTCAADVVVVGRIEKIATKRGPGAVVYDDCTVTVQESIKGKIKDKSLVFCLRSLSPDSPARAWMKSRGQLLLFLSESKDHGSEKHLDHMLVPTSHQVPLSVIDLAAPGKYVLDTHFKVLKDRKAILEACRKTADRLVDYRKKNPGRAVEAERLEAPLDSEAWHALYHGSSCYVKAPVFAAKPKK